jgi:toxin ParE1/3/4
VSRKVVLAPEARTDLFGIYTYISERSGIARALAYVERIEAYCKGFADFPERGTRRDDLSPGLRVIGLRGVLR